MLPLLAPTALAAGLGLCLLAFAGWAMFADDPLGGEPMTVVNADGVANGGKTSDAAPAAPDAPDTASAAGASQQASGPPPGSKTITIIDGTSGKRQEVVIPGNGEVKAADGKAPDGKLHALDERVSEPSRHGLLPKVAEDGARPSEVFARPVKPISGKPNAPRIAIMIGGLGIGATVTNDAIRKLPGAVTLAFGGYGGDLERQVSRARDAGHEVVLQVPMEPFDYPDNDPGPQTLLTALDAAQNVDRLHWLMSRFQGYVGIANLMGARFTASESALAPVLRETAKRGLIYVDDGSSPRSLASQIAGANNLAFAKADMTLDQVATAADIDRALTRLEATARERGVAVGVASAVPVSIERIARWAKTAGKHGILLIPITAAVAKARPS
jgi:polysaccharide deacetylase 2 family uncharacterized protein YibQ